MKSQLGLHLKPDFQAEESRPRLSCERSTENLVTHSDPKGPAASTGDDLLRAVRKEEISQLCLPAAEDLKVAMWGTAVGHSPPHGRRLEGHGQTLEGSTQHPQLPCRPHGSGERRAQAAPKNCPHRDFRDGLPLTCAWRQSRAIRSPALTPLGSPGTARALRPDRTVLPPGPLPAPLSEHCPPPRRETSPGKDPVSAGAPSLLLDSSSSLL